MGCFDIACPVCGAPTVKPDSKAQWCATNGKMLEWLGNLVAIRDDSEPFFGTYDCYGRVENGPSSVDVYCGEAIGMHQRCWELLGRPNYDWLVKHHIFSGDNKYLKPFKDYANQFYDWEGFIEANIDLWAAFDPYLDETNRNRIRIMKKI